MELEEAKMNKENYCVNCKHYVKIGRRDACRNNLIVSSYINNVTGEKFYDDKSCYHTRIIVCKGKHFEPKISVWTKFVNLFKLEATVLTNK